MVHLDQYIGFIVVEEIVRDARALRHPVQPQPQAGPVDVVPGDLNINGAVKFDAAPENNFRT